MKTLYISDMDGTLLNDGGKVSRRSVEIINELIKDDYKRIEDEARKNIS